VRRESLGREAPAVQLQAWDLPWANGWGDAALCFPPETFAATHHLCQHNTVISVVVF